MQFSYIGSLIFLSLFLGTLLHGQESITISRKEAEAIFLDQNLDLIAERLEIPKAQAAVLQAKLWPNPTFSIDEMNFWALPGQIEPLGEELPPLFGNFGKHFQFSFGIEQLIQTAGKRKKLMAVEQISADKAHGYLEDLLRNLKVEFRHLLTELQFLQFQEQVYLDQIDVVRQLTSSFDRQVDLGHISRGELVRLRALELQFSKYGQEIRKEINEKQKELKILMRLPSESDLVITDEDFVIDTDQVHALQLPDLLKTVQSSRPDLKLASLEEKYHENVLNYEKAQRIPDINLKAGYDRGGNILYNFIGFGVDIELPLFNKNQGNIEAARIGIVQSRYKYDQKIHLIENELVLAFRNLLEALEFYESIDTDYETALDDILEGYIRNFQSRNISLLEFIDYLEAYIENKEIILKAGMDLHFKAEELNYSMGTDVLN